MKKLTLFVLLAWIFQVSAQKTQNSYPKSWSISTMNTIKPITFSKPDLKTLRAEDAINDKDKSIPWRFGFDHFVDYGLNTAGEWYELPNGDRIWRINFVSTGALTMNVLFDRYKIPVGGKVYIYNDDRSEILNTFSHLHNNPEEILGTWMVTGESLWIEYFEPKEVQGQGKLNIGNVIHGYRTLKMNNENAIPKALNDSGPCNVDVNCDLTTVSAAANTIKENTKTAVGMVLVSGGNGFCSGALVNNTSNDGTPYFLTANHCLGGSVAGWAFRFNWESDATVADCATNAPSADGPFIQTASGATLRASNYDSDMALLEITDTTFFTNNSANLLWAGWNRSTTDISTLAVGIHHPRGDIKKVAVYLQSPARVTTDIFGAPFEAWRIADWDFGVTEQGSSGSPLFDDNGLIIGKLSGGTAACVGTNDNGEFDDYGRFAVSWDRSPLNSEQLRFWLDPAGTNPVAVQAFPNVQATANDAAISVSNIPANICNASIVPTLRISNIGNNPLTSATITYQLDTETPTTINWTGNLTSNQSEDIPLDEITVAGNGAHSFTASISNPNGNTDEFTINDTNSIEFNAPNFDIYQTSVIRVIITPDRFGAETTWEITDSSGAQIATGGPYETVDSNGTQPDQVQDVTITDFNECYAFSLIDSYGDGICCQYGDGTYRLEDGNGNILLNGTGDFGGIATNEFKVSDGSNPLATIVRIYPNPSTTDFTVFLANYTNVIYEVHNITGQQVLTGAFTNGINTLTMQNEAAGLYFIRVIDIATNTSTVKKLIKY